MTLKSTIMQTSQPKQSLTAWKPHAYQKRAVKLMLQNSWLGLLLDPGLGKTSISLAAAKVLLERGEIDRVLVIAPLRPCYQVWPKESKKWKDFSNLRLTILHGPKKERELESDAQVFLINPEGLAWLLKHKRFPARFSGQMLVIDESTKFKDAATQRFKLLKNGLHIFARRYILTGTPVPNGLLDLFGQIFILDLGRTLGKFVTHYRNKFFYPSGFGGYDWKPVPGAQEAIQEAIRPITLRLDAKDYLELPELIYNNIYVDLPEKAVDLYNEMEDELVAGLRNRDIVAVNAAVASGKCSQIANGGIYDEDGKYHFVHDTKTDAVDELLEELNGSPALIAYEYGHDLDRLRSRLGVTTPYIGGGVSPKRAVEIEDQWNAGKLPVLLGQPASMAHGLNLQEAGNHVIWHSLTWNYEHYDQLIRRVYRQGNKHKKVFVHHIIAKGTIDEVKLFALNRKHRTQQDLFDALNTFFREKKKL